MKHSSRVSFGALTIETTLDVLRPRIFALGQFSHACIFCHQLLNFQSFSVLPLKRAIEIPEGKEEARTFELAHQCCCGYEQSWFPELRKSV